MLTKTFPDLSYFKKRRDFLNKNYPGSTFVFFSGKESHLSRFRAKSSFVYFTGFEEPEAAVVIRTGKDYSYNLFVRPKDPAIEIWDGERYGVERAGQEFEADQCFSIEELEAELPKLLRGSRTLYFNLGDEIEYDEMLLHSRKVAQQMDRRSGSEMVSIEDPRSVLNQMRVIKDELEIQCLKESCELSAKAHNLIMKSVRPGMNERQVQGILLGSFYDQLAYQEGYSSIIASGANACTLHYRANNRGMEDGDFLLIDAGAEKSYYTADITRTYPINGQFTKPQKEIYLAVLEVQEKLIEQAVVGFSLPELHQSSCGLLTEKMIDLGLLKGSVSDRLEDGSFKKYYPHGVGHYLGMDVHDVGLSKKGKDPVPFVAGMVHTIEPGIYVPEDDQQAPKELRGLGVRIEDDILITESGNDVLTGSCIKDVEELEKNIQTSQIIS